MNKFLVSVNEANQRLDKYLAQQLTTYSRSQIQAAIKQGSITVNSLMVNPNYLLKEEDEITVAIKAKAEIVPVKSPLELVIVYEDADILVINKPAGLVVHSGAGQEQDTVVGRLLHYGTSLADSGASERPGIVHRLDKNTSGLLIVAKTNSAWAALSQQFKNQSAVREYTALVYGELEAEHGTIDAPIGRDPHNRQRMAVTATNSKDAISHFQVIKRYNGYTLVKCQLVTGRTHQLRVHLAYIGHPIVGDTYNRRKNRFLVERQLLHASRLVFKHPLTGVELTFSAELPPDFALVLKEVEL